jgi:UDP-glucose 4-epimerase
MQIKRVLVTGVSGYIGGQTAIQLNDLGHDIWGVDQKPLPHPGILGSERFLQADFASDQGLELIKGVNPDVIIHCAGTSLVGPSVSNPGEYYENNFIRTKRLLDRMILMGSRSRIIFSSSASVYGDPLITPCQEEDPPLPMSPYGGSKLMIEMMLRSYHLAHGVDYVAFRYFNACGADPLARHGQEPGATHIIARVLESMRDGTKFTLYGDQYPTADGTCIRDYVHVADIARAHIMAMDQRVAADIYNLGSNAGFSNRDVITRAERVTSRTVDLGVGGMRTGDPAVLTASFDKFKRITGWQPEYTLESMLEHAWNWYVR